MKQRLLVSALGKYRFSLTLALLFVVQLAIIGAFFFMVALDMNESQQALFSRQLQERIPLLCGLAVLLLFALGVGLKFWFDTYIIPVKRLVEDAALLAANPAHRATSQGIHDLRAAIGTINDLAAARQSLLDEVQARIESANRALAEEKDRLAALMSELALSVLVCNIEGRILLYNARAKALLDSHPGDTSTPSHATVGLGRSVFGAIERGLIVHALEQIQHRLLEPGNDVARPVTGFIATLAEGQIVRAQIAPVLDDAQALNGFVLTLEDITRKVEADSRRDTLLQSLTQETRATLASIRAALETMQTFPDMSAEKRAQFSAIIDAESQHLVRDIERATQQYGAAFDTSWQLEEMRGADLVALLLRRVDAGPLHVTASNSIDPAMWLEVDSYALTQMVSSLARRLASELGVSELHIGLLHTGRLALLELTWNGAPLTAETLRGWEHTPLPIGAAGAALTLQSVVARHGGETAYRFDMAQNASCYRLLLPATEPRQAFDLPQKQRDRPVFYDFDLFHQSGQSAELDQTPLTRLSYTVFDTETTGLHPAGGDEIISLGAVRIVNGKLLQQESFDQLVQPRRALPAESIAIHGITDAMLYGQPTIEKVLPHFHGFAEGTVLVAHNAAFDMRFLQMKEEQSGVTFNQPLLDTLLLSQVIHPNQPLHTLEAIATRLGVAVVGRHTALGDAIVTGEVLLKMIPLLAEKGVVTLRDAREAAQQTPYARIRY